MVVVPKVGGKLRMCIDFRDLNKVCPKDYFSLPSIDRLVESMSEHELFRFVDTYSGYHHVLMHPGDAKKTYFITENRLYYYVVMSFGLLNARATYQLLMTKLFQGQIGHNVEVYMDNMVIKSWRASNHLANL